MGRLRAPLAALAVASLAFGCTVKTEGAPCGDDSQCPTGQACGYNRVCSVEAGQCLTGTPCRDETCESPGGSAPKGPRRCAADSGGVCATLEPPTTCSSGTCGVVGGVADCLAVALANPGDVGAAGKSVSATLTFISSRFMPPPSIELLEDDAPALTMQRTTAVDVNPAIYGGLYVPTEPIETTVPPVTLKAVVTAQPTEVSDFVTVNVDNRPPRITVDVRCGSSPSPNPCLRDDVLRVTAIVDEANLTPSSVQVSLDLDGYQAATQLGGSAPDFTKDLWLRQWPFAGLARDVVVRVTASDTYGNSGSGVATLAGVTRLRTTHDTQTGAAVTSPAFENDGTIVFGAATTTGQLRAINPDADATQAFPPVTLEIVSGQGGRPLRAAPSIGAADIFAGSEDGRIYRRMPDGGPPSGVARYPSATDTSLVPLLPLYAVTVNTVAGVDHAYSAGRWAMLHQFYSNEVTASRPITDPAYSAGVFAGANPFLVTSDSTTATIRRFDDMPLTPTELSSIALADPGPPVVPCDSVGRAEIGGVAVQVPLAVDGGGNVIAACDNGQVHRVANASPLVDELLYKLPAGVSPTGSPVVLADGGILLPTSDGNVRKLVPSGSAATAWTTPASVTASAGEFPTGVAAADDTSGEPAIYATTSQGRIVALNKDGVEKWSGVLEAGAALGFPTIAPVPASAPASALPTLYAGSSTGKLFRVIVDFGLDPNAPWPKAHHDIRNTGSSTSALF